MRQVAGLISTYSSDEFGICSALYELGGMVVMHDASGCNSTYTTHDEPRWYDIESLIFISAISEVEAIMGDDDKFINDLVETANELHPKFIALVGAPIPYMIGTDLDAIADIVAHETGIPSFGFAANGMHHYTTGISMAMERVVKEFASKKEKKPNQVNIIGATPLDFSLNGSVPSMEKWLKDHGFEMGTCLAMGCTLEKIADMGSAQINLVVSYGGLAAAKYMEKTFGIPYILGVPFGETYGKMLAEEMHSTIENKANNQKEHSNKTDRQENARHQKVCIIGESVFSVSLANALEMIYQVDTKVLCPVDTKTECLRKQDVMAEEEDDIIELIADADTVIADPLYRGLIGKQEFVPLPHEAFSGRIYDAENPNLMGNGFEHYFNKFF